MSDHQRTIEFLRDFRASGVQTVTDEVREAAAAYATLCTTGNDRLRQCAMLLQRGLRAEAVHLAESPPNLLDLIAALDLPDPEGWAEFCQRNDLPVPPPLQLDRAAQLNDAYGQDQPLQQLYAKHRRLALARGPLVERLDVMRQLGSADPGPFWEKDIRTFEQARFKELRVGLATAAREHDAAALQSLSGEVLRSPWFETIPPDLLSMSQEIDHRANKAFATSETAGLLTKLRAAYAAKSLAECASLLEQLKQQQETLGLATLDDTAASDLREIAAWVQHQQKSLARKKAFTDACDALADALNNGAPGRELAAAYAAAANFGKPVPPELHERYEAKLKERARAARMRNIGIVAGLAAVLAIGFGLFYWQTQQGVAREWAQRIEKAVSERNVGLAQQLIKEQESLAPDASSHPEVASAKKSATALAEQMDRDREWVKGMLAILNGASDKAMSALDNGTGPDQWWTASLEIDNALSQWGRPAEAQRMDPKNQVATAAEQLQQQRESLRNRYSAWLVSQVDAAVRTAGSPQVAPVAADIADAEAALADAEKQIAAIMPQLDRGGEPATAAVREASPRLSAVRDAIRQARDEYEARQSLPSAAGSVATARKALLEFVARFPESDLSADFSRAAAVLDVHETVDSYLAMTTPWVTAPSTPAPKNEKIARERLDAVRGFADSNPQCPLLPAAKGYGDYMQQAASAMAIPNAWQLEMGEIISSPLMSELSYLEVNDNTRYYVLGDPAVQKQGVGTRIRWIFDVIDPQNLARRKTVTLAAPKQLVSDKPTLLPHAVFVRNLAEQMKTVDDRSWETWGIDLVDRLVAADELNPVVRAILLRDALRATARIDGWAIGDLYDRSIADLERQKLDNIVWYDINSPVPEVTLASLKTIVAKVPSGETARKLVADRRASLFASLRPPLSGTAMLLRDESGKWQVATATATSATTALAIRPTDRADAGAAAPTRTAAVPAFRSLAFGATFAIAGPMQVSATAPAASTTKPATSTTKPATVPATQPATDVTSELPTPPPAPTAPPISPAPLSPPKLVAPAAAPAQMVPVASRGADGKWVIDEAAVADLPQGTVLFLSR